MSDRHSSKQGQVLVLFAGVVIGLFAVAAVAIDLSSVYSTQQTEKAAADAAALAGAQDLQVPGSTALGNPTTARQHALDDLAGRFGVSVPLPTTPGCNPTADMTDCALSGSPYHVAISTPSKTTGDPRSLQVSVFNPNFQLSFARLFGQNGWNVGKTSVAVIDFGTHYALITLRPPNPLKKSDQNYDNIKVTGGSVVTIQGDVGTNTNLVVSGTSAAGTNSQVILGTGNQVYYYDSYLAWTPPPPGQEIFAPIPDPDYWPTGISNPQAGASPGSQDTSGCTAEINKAVAAGYVGHSSSGDYTKTYPLSATNTSCWTPGIYNTDLIGNYMSKQSGGANLQTALLEPGVYFFNGGMTMNGTLIGGYEGGKEGVALVFPEANNVNSGAFAGNNATLVSLNMGSCVPNQSAPSCTAFAAPAQTAGGTNVQVVFKSSKSNIVAPETLIVAPKDPNCTVGTTENSLCNDTGNNTVNLPGGGNLFVAGVQYAPSDNVKIVGGSGGIGFLGQIVAWTVQYSGGTEVNEIYPGNLGNGVLRLDSACSGPGTSCIP